jgi:hypothetical protein
MIGIAILKDWHRNICIPSQGWGEEWWRPPSIGITSSLTILNSFCREDATVPATHAHSGQGKIHTPIKFSQARKLIPSSLGRHLPRWSTSLSNKKEIRPCVPRYSAFGVLTIESGIWPRTWPTSKNCTTIHDGRNTTPYTPWPTPMPFAALSHTSSTMP